MDQLVLLVIIGLISLINWVMQKAAEKRELAKLEREEREAGKQSVYRQPPPPRRTTERRAQQPQQNPLKELMEALGLPPDAATPPPAVPRTLPEPEEEFASLEDTTPRTPRWQAPQFRRPDEKMAQLASSFAAKEKMPIGQKPRPASVRAMLADRTSQRHAIVLAEILGTPRGLQSLL